MNGLKNHSPRRPQSPQSLLEGFSVTSVGSVVKSFGKPTRLATPDFFNRVGNLCSNR